MTLAIAPSRIKIEFAQASDPGRDPNKQVNEDSCGYAETKFGHLCVLCDGMGGHYGGKEASRLAITTIFEVVEQASPTATPAVVLKSALEEAGRRVYRLGGPPENRTRPGSTAVAMLLHDRGVDVAHVGDSRAYVIRSNQIYPLTRDHSMVQGMIDAGLLTEAQAMGHPDANKITRALGMKPEVEVEVRPEPMELFPGDLLLLASDGLTDLAMAADILGCTRQALASGSVSNACNELVRMANDRGGHDNITVQLARVVEVQPKTGLTIPQAPSAGQVPVGVTPAPGGGVVETVAMTSPDMTSSAGAPNGVHAPPVQWAPVPPTATDAPAGPLPTIPEHGPASSPAWSSGVYTGPQPGAAEPVATPPPAGSTQAAPGVTVMAAPGPTPTMTPHPGGVAGDAGPTLPASSGPYGRAYTPAPSAASYPDAAPSRGGIVFVVIGMSAVIAVLLVLLIWALFLR